MAHRSVAAEQRARLSAHLRRLDALDVDYRALDAVCPGDVDDSF
ncbi:hypothetical protein [Salinibacter altiplanensis]|nr:hypothetical protein [Salinibacter altiplanensis]